MLVIVVLLSEKAILQAIQVKYDRETIKKKLVQQMEF